MQSLNFNAADSNQIAKAAEKAGISSNTFFSFEQNTETGFFLLPPWSSKGSLAREVWEGYLPEKKRWIFWLTWKDEDPDFPNSDPVLCYINSLISDPSANQDELRRMVPRPRYYANALIFGSKKISGNGQFQRSTSFETPQIASLPSKVWNGICALMMRPGFEVPYDPTKAILFLVSRVGSGLNTEYKIDFAGTRGAMGETTPSRYDLRDLVSGKEDQIRDILSNLPDLTKKWSRPDLADDPRIRSYAEEVKRAIKTKVLSGSSSGIPGVSGTFQNPHSSGFVETNQNNHSQVNVPPPPVFPSSSPLVPSAPMTPSGGNFPNPSSAGLPSPSSLPSVPNIQVPAFPAFGK